MRFARADVRDHIVSRKNDQGPSHRSYGPLQRRKGMKIDFREIFGVVRFSTFATLSARSRSRYLAERSVVSQNTAVAKRRLHQTAPR